VANDNLERVRADIERTGWHAVLVASGKDEEWKPPFAYSVGISSQKNLPELSIFGLPSAVSYKILQSARRELLKNGKIRKGAVIKNVLEDGYLIKVGGYVAYDSVNEYFGVAIDYYSTKKIKIAVLLWPDSSGDINMSGGNENPQYEAFQLLDISRPTDTL